MCQRLTHKLQPCGCAHVGFLKGDRHGLHISGSPPSNMLPGVLPASGNGEATPWLQANLGGRIAVVPIEIL